jgi:hypothetical protein
LQDYTRSISHPSMILKKKWSNQACKLRRECAEEITEDLHRNFAEIPPMALNILTNLAENAESESVRLGATRDLLDRACLA